MIVSFLYAYYKKMKWWAFAIMFYFNYEFYQLSKSRTAFYCGSAAIIAYFILRYARKIYEFKISLILLEIGNLVGIFLSIYYGLYSQSDKIKIIRRGLRFPAHFPSRSSSSNSESAVTVSPRKRRQRTPSRSSETVISSARSARA